MLVFPVI